MDSAHAQEEGELTTGATLTDEHRLIVAGHGGQGILTLGKLVCMCAVAGGKNVSYLPSYGPEVRSGTASCRVVISTNAIHNPLIEEADSLVILNQPSYERFGPRLRPGGLLLVNSSAVKVTNARAVNLVPVPAAETAAEMGHVVVANVILLGAFVHLIPFLDAESCLSAVKEWLGRRKAHLLELNVRALARGAELARQVTEGPASGETGREA